MKSILKVVLAAFLSLILLSSAVVRTQADTPAAGIAFTINSSADLPDATPDDGIWKQLPGMAAAGGGLYLEGWSQSSFTLSNVVISDNSIVTDSYAGAGLQFESGDYDQGGPYSGLLIQDSTIQNNRAVPLTSGTPWVVALISVMAC